MARWQRRQPTQMRIAPTIAAAVIRPAYKGFIGIVRRPGDLTNQDDDGGYFVRPPGLRLRAYTAKCSQRRAGVRRTPGGTIQGRRWLAPPVANPTAQENIKPLDDANDEPRRVCAEQALLQNGFLVDRGASILTD